MVGLRGLARLLSSATQARTCLLSLRSVVVGLPSPVFVQIWLVFTYKTLKHVFQPRQEDDSNKPNNLKPNIILIDKVSLPHSPVFSPA